MKETDLFQPVKQWLEDGGHTVYSEVSHSLYGGRRADIVAVHGSIYTVVELKTSLSLDLIEQAYSWKKDAHYVYVCTPMPKGSTNRFAEKLLRQYGIGLLQVVFNKDARFTYVHQEGYCVPRINRRVTGDLQKAVTEYHKNNPPGGSQAGGYVTAYKITMMHVKEYLEMQKWRRNPNGWVTINEILDNVTTHYSSPKQSLSKALMSFEQEWCESQKVNGKLMFRMKVEQTDVHHMHR